MSEPISTAERNRNILFAVIARQLEFIDSPQLAEAIRNWKQDDHSSLDRILVQMQMIDEPTCSLILEVMEKQLQAQELSLEESIDSKRDFISTIQVELQALDCADVESTLELNVASDDTGRGNQGQTSDKTTVPPAGFTASASRYRTVRPHASGGLGQVSVAIDSELNREVALKELRDKHADDVDSRLRFMFEAEVTGGLEHPGIVPVYGLGMYRNGRPFYAMRFIRGESLKEAIDTFHQKDGKRERLKREDAGLRRLLNRFVDICNAIEYAHSQGVIHRDLKPANVMLGKFGETLVVDWGLSKLQRTGDRHPSPVGDASALFRDSKATETRVGAIVGTPAFMAPEQAAGELEEMGPWSDVYSLGATLYYLLSSHPPYRNGNPTEIVEQVKEGSFEPLSNGATKIPKPLVAICEKAMALGVKDRYESPTAIANDIESWLADEPVTCYREPLPLRSARWLRRHRSVTSSIGMAVVVSIVALAIASILLNQKNRELQVAKDDAEFFESEATLRNEKLINAMADIVGPVQLALQNNAGTDETRQALLVAAVKNLADVKDSFSTGSRRDTTTVSALIGLAKLALTLDTGTARKISVAENNESLSPLELSESYYIAAAETAQQLLENNPDDQAAITLRGEAIVGIGDTLARRGMVKEAIEKYEQALAIFQSVVDLQDDTDEDSLLDAKNNVAVALDRLADVYLSQRDNANAEANYLRALEIRSEAAARDPDSINRKRLELVANNQLGDLYLNSGRISEAAINYERSREEFDELVQRFPDNQRLAHDLSVTLEKVGIIHATRLQRAEGIRYFQLALEIREEILSKNPLNAEFLRSVGKLYTMLGRLQNVDAQTANALESFRQAAKHLQTLVDRDPNDVKAKKDLALAYEDLGAHHQKTLRWEEAFRELERARVIRDQLVVQFPDDLVILDESAAPHYKLGEVLEATKRFEEALQRYRRSLEISTVIVGEANSGPRELRDLSMSHEKIGDIQRQLEDYPNALLSYREALRISERLFEERGEPQNKYDLGVSYAVLANGLRLAGQLEEADTMFQLAFEIRSEMVKENPSSREVKARLADSYADRGNLAMDRGRHARALNAFREAIQILEPLAKEDQANILRQYDLSLLYVRIARASSALGDFASAVSSFDAALENESLLLDMEDELNGWKNLRDEAVANRFALGDWATIEALGEPERREAVIRRVAVQLRLGRIEEAIETSDRWDSIRVDEAAYIVDQAKAHGKIVVALASDDIWPEQKREEEIRRQQQRAIEKIREAIDAGFSDMNALADTPEFQSLNEQPEFKRLLERLQDESDDRASVSRLDA